MSEIFNTLKDRYNKSTLTKKELANELNLSVQTIDRRIKEGLGIPNYIRSGKGIKSSYIFPIHEVCKFLESTIKVY